MQGGDATPNSSCGGAPTPKSGILGKSREAHWDFKKSKHTEPEHFLPIYPAPQIFSQPAESIRISLLVHTVMRLGNPGHQHDSSFIQATHLSTISYWRSSNQKLIPHPNLGNRDLFYDRIETV